MQCKCGETNSNRFSFRKDTGTYRNECKGCQNIRKRKWKNEHPEQHRASVLVLYPWRAYKKAQCEECGFLPKHSCQLDVDHVDSNKKNNDPSNLRTLCSNCHRLKTYTDIINGKVVTGRKGNS